LMEKAERYSGCSEDYDGVQCVIHIHRTGEAVSKTLNPNSLWKSFRDKTERGVREIDYSLLGTFGTPWIPYRFSFGKWETFYQHIPSVIVFTTSIWFSWAAAETLSIWLYRNPFNFPNQLQYFVRWFFYLPIIGFPFLIGWIAHVMMDWAVSIESSKMNEEKRAILKEVGSDTTDDDDDSFNSDLYSEQMITRDTTKNKSLMTGGRVGPDGEFVEEDSPDGVLFESKMIVLNSTSGRPDLVTVMHNDSEEDWDSNGVYMCGPEKLIQGCKSAASTLTCTYGADRIQNLIKGNKFAFYEEKFEW